MPLSPDEVVRAWFRDVWTNGDAAAIDRLMASHAVVHDLPGPGPMQGPPAFTPFFHRFRGALPDVRVEVLRTIADGPFVAAHCRVTGTHTGNTLGIPATGRPVDITGMTIAKVENGQIVEGWNAFDFMSMFQQLGILPALPA